MQSRSLSAAQPVAALSLGTHQVPNSWLLGWEATVLALLLLLPPSWSPVRGAPCCCCTVLLGSVLPGSGGGQAEASRCSKYGVPRSAAHSSCSSGSTAVRQRYTRELEVDWGALVPGTNTAEGAATTSDPSLTHPKVLHPIL
jgi:hypothetical protein